MLSAHCGVAEWVEQAGRYPPVLSSNPSGRCTACVPSGCGIMWRLDGAVAPGLYFLDEPPAAVAAGSVLSVSLCVAARATMAV
jgi:hypothetical protein